MNKLRLSNVLLVLVALIGCQPTSMFDYSKDHLNVRALREGDKVKLFIRSDNPRYDCINIAAFDFDAPTEAFEYTGAKNDGAWTEKTPSKTEKIFKLREKIGVEDIRSEGQNYEAHLLNIYQNEKHINLPYEIGNISFYVFNCEKYRKGQDQYAYVFVSRNF